MSAIFQQKLESALIQAFDELSSNPEQTVAYARTYSLNGWIMEQRAAVVTSGAVANLIPGAHLLAMVADLVFLLNRMSYCAWGIGAIKKCKVFGMSDFEQILVLWCEESPNWDDFSAISLSFASAAINISEFDPNEMDDHAYYNQIANAHASGNSLISSVRNVNNYHGANGLKKKLARKKVVKLGAKLATKLSIKLAKKLGAKAFAGAVPIVGSIVGGGVNLWIINGLIEAADKYYSRAK